MKRLTLLFVLVAALFFLLGSSALANFALHGGYLKDTDLCAGCHRAHTAVSPITWTDTGLGVKSALLIGSPLATTMQAFCYTCHGNAGAGAATNVQSGVYDNSVGRVGTNFPYVTNSTYLGTLNGGGFDATPTLAPGNTKQTPTVAGLSPVTSWHLADGTSGVAWGGSLPTVTGGIQMALDCASCHDPHGTSNYRILKDTVNGLPAGGYLGDFATDINPTPNPWVISNEVGYPNGVGGADLGFRLHKNYSDLDGDGIYGEPGDYVPDYTTARYAQPVGLDVAKGVSGWCARCHTLYNTISSSGQGAYNAADGYGNVDRHRHPVNQPLSTFLGDRALLIDDPDGPGPLFSDTNTPWGDVVDIPLEHAPATDGQGNAQTQAMTDYLGCLTCHRAHGTSVTMRGWANATITPAGSPKLNPIGSETSNGVPPTSDSALLRASDRGVCERCHNK